jgi:hypothetical protein
MIKWNTIASEPKTSRNVPVNDPEVEERVILEADVEAGGTAGGGLEG